MERISPGGMQSAGDRVGSRLDTLAPGFLYRGARAVGSTRRVLCLYDVRVRLPRPGLIWRGSSVGLEQRNHNPEVAGSSPAPATNKKPLFNRHF
jgi:hypothetical protein